MYSKFVIYCEAPSEDVAVATTYAASLLQQPACLPVQRGPGAHLPPGTRVRPGEPWKGVIEFDDGSVLSEEETHRFTCQELYNRGVRKVIIHIPLDVIGDT